MHFYKYLIFYCCGDGFNWIMCWWMRLNWETKKRFQKIGTHKKVASAGSAAIGGGGGCQTKKTGSGQGLEEDGSCGGNSNSKTVPSCSPHSTEELPFLSKKTGSASVAGTSGPSHERPKSLKQGGLLFPSPTCLVLLELLAGLW